MRATARSQQRDRQTIANQLQSLRDQLTAVANRTDTNGIPLLGALGSAQSPFMGPLNGIPDYEFAGQAGQTASDGVTLPNTLDGDSAFMFDAKRDGSFHTATGEHHRRAPPTPHACPPGQRRTGTTLSHHRG